MNHDNNLPSPKIFPQITPGPLLAVREAEVAWGCPRSEGQGTPWVVVYESPQPVAVGCAVRGGIVTALILSKVIV